MLAFRQGADFYFSRYERLLAREDYVDALSALRTAHEKAPDNLEYTMELAELYTEMDFYEESNCLLLGIFSKEPGYQEECLYGMGCNFFGLQDPAGAQGNALLKSRNITPTGAMRRTPEISSTIWTRRQRTTTSRLR